MKLTKHARIEILLVTALLLGSCNGMGLTNKQKDQVGDIAGDVVGDAIADDDTVRDLTERVEALEKRLNM